MANVLLRTASVRDIDALSQLKLETFRETFLEGGFGIAYPPADLASFEADTYGSHNIARELQDPGHATWVAESEGRLLAYAHVGPTKLPHPEADSQHGELYQLYVRREAQGIGLGARLMALALEHLTSKRPGPIWLGVWSGNHRAQALYEANGFAKVGEYEFQVGTWRDLEFIFRRG